MLKVNKYVDVLLEYLKVACKNNYGLQNCLASKAVHLYTWYKLCMNFDRRA